MFDLGFYIRLIPGLCFILAGFLAIYQYKKNSMKYKYGRLQAILLFLAGVLMISSAALAYFYGV